MERTPYVEAASRRSGYQNAMLTAIAVLLALGVIDRHAGSRDAISGLTEPAQASAQQPSDGGMTNRLEQNKQMIAELQKMNGKLDRIESKLSSGISVKVTDMPALKLPPELKAKSADNKQSVDVKPPDGAGK